VNQSLRSYTTVEVAKRLGVSMQTVQRWVDAGYLQAWKTLGGHRRIEASSAERLFREQDERIGTTPAALPGAATEPPRISVVVVDDDPRDLALLVTLVQIALPDAHVETAENGFQGLVEIGRLTPAIVVTDLHMPHMDGFEMMRNLMLDEATRPRLMVAVTARTAGEVAHEQPMPQGVVLMTKPLDHARFIGLLQRPL